MKYTIGEMLEELTGLTYQQWGGYAFYHEPLERKFSPEQKVEYTRKANACGEEEAEKMLMEYPGKNIREIAEEMGFTVKTPKTPTGGGHVILAQYVEPKGDHGFHGLRGKSRRTDRKRKASAFSSGF